MTEENFYVGIDNPVEVRKDILQASKEVIINLQTFEDLREIRIEKLNEIENYKKDMSEIRALIRKLRKHFPKKLIHEQTGSKKTKTKIKIESRGPVKKQNLSQFEDELASLEEEINSMK